MIGWYDMDHNPISVEEADQLLQSEERQIALTELDGGWTVSTIFLVLDHQFVPDAPPLLYETVVFDPGRESYTQDRYQTRAQAIAGHDQLVAFIRDLIKEKKT